MKHMLSRTALTMAVLSALGTASVGLLMQDQQYRK